MFSKRVNKESLLLSLEMVLPGVAVKQIIEQSSCFVFQGDRVWSFNGEVCCSFPSKLGKEFTGAVFAKTLLAILRGMPEDEVVLEEKGGDLVILGKGRKAGVHLDKEVALPLNKVDQPSAWKPLPDDFCEAVGVVQECAGEDQSRFDLTCLHLHPKWVEACNAVQLARYHLKTGFSKPYLVRRDAIKAIATLSMREFSETESWLHFRNTAGLVYSCCRYEESYPDLTNLITMKGEQTSLPPGLSEACVRAEVFSEENSDNNVVLIDLQPGRVRVKGEGLTGWFSESKKVNYSGRGMKFFISPKMLARIVQNHSECELVDDRLKVNGGSFIFVACIAPKDEAAHD